MSSLKYGLTLNDIQFIDNKLEKQKSFLKNYIFDFGLNEKFNLLDSSMSANINPTKYFSEVNNRVNSLFGYSKMINFSPVFLTITLPSRFHPSSNDYDQTLSIKDGVRYLSDSWRSFRDLKIFRAIKKATGHNVVFIKVFEPHKSGVPHLHVLIFVPKNFILPLKKVFKRHFTGDGASTYAQNFRYVWSNSSGGAVAYLMKYINKTFKHALDDVMTMESYYFVKYRIIRFTCSRTLCPVYIHRKVKHDQRFRDFLRLTYFYKSGLIYTLFEKKFIFFRCMEEEREEEVIYQKNANIDLLFKKSNHVQKPLHYTKKNPIAPIYFDDEKTDFVFSWGRAFVPKKRFESYSNYELLNYYNNFDYTSADENHYCYIRNLLIDRGLLDGEKYGFSEWQSIPI